ncbi:fluoride efflux transporter CrcB [Croceicoccus naphthovorans]|uniref:Fluoride-specific ion channel FluC n=1 Tax=Croceicoccus naphthovorans TaxID=1348774 RepID=A0A0G3XJN4_9SPHN|nr:fluoride efflux transporter CrcB [Croceicoccus naphthovorans]AKM10809.1 camphor resistance protein CrcB [Croceicoccus naphthovorans]MBB3989017.1 CrcB protein [Croceicoccus naphthovorans]
MAQPTTLVATSLVALGGGTGAVLRYHLGRAVGALFPTAALAFPYATLTANVVGSLCMGLLAGWLARYGSAEAEGWRLLLGVGLLGGFTTFSSFSLEVMLLWERGAPGLAALYAIVSVAAGVAGLFLGLIVMRMAA